MIDAVDVTAPEGPERVGRMGGFQDLNCHRELGQRSQAFTSGPPFYGAIVLPRMEDDTIDHGNNCDTMGYYYYYLGSCQGQARRHVLVHLSLYISQSCHP